MFGGKENDSTFCGSPLFIQFCKSSRAVLLAENPALPIGAFKKEKRKRRQKRFEDESGFEFAEGK